MNDETREAGSDGREDPGSGDRFVAWKVRLFALGAALALVGMALSFRWMVWAALVVLGAGLALRFVGKRATRK